MIRKQILLKTFLLFFLVLLVACKSQATIITPTNTPFQPSTFTPLPSNTPEFIVITPSPLPTQPPIPIITPDAIQVERWREYEDALAQSILPMFSFESILCEWDILGRENQEVYVWAICTFANKGDDMRPVVIHLEPDGSIHSVEIPKRGSSSDINRMFPEEVQVKFSLYTGNSLFDGRVKEMLDHLNYRETHPGVLPLIVLSTTPAP